MPPSSSLKLRRYYHDLLSSFFSILSVTLSCTFGVLLPLGAAQQALAARDQLVMRLAPFAAYRSLWRERAGAAVEEQEEEEKAPAGGSPLDLDIGGEGGYFDHDAVSGLTNMIDCLTSGSQLLKGPT